MIFLSPAKINLSLEVGKKLPDNYHLVRTVMQEVSLYDRVSVLPDPSGAVRFRCDWTGVRFCGKQAPCGDDKNIAYKAALLMKEVLNETLGARITITKNIPVGAGLGGGSSNAAAVLRGLLWLWKKRLSPSTLRTTALSLGADVNYFLYGGCCLGVHKGEEITRLRPEWAKDPLWILLVNPGIYLSTREVYEGLSILPPKKRKTPGMRQITRLDKLSSCLYNRLEDVAFIKHPEIRDIKESIAACRGCAGALMSGSGSSVFGIFPSRHDAVTAHGKMKKVYPHSWVLSTVNNRGR